MNNEARDSGLVSEARDTGFTASGERPSVIRQCYVQLPVLSSVATVALVHFWSDLPRRNSTRQVAKAVAKAKEPFAQGDVRKHGTSIHQGVLHKVVYMACTSWISHYDDYVAGVAYTPRLIQHDFLDHSDIDHFNILQPPRHAFGFVRTCHSVWFRSVTVARGWSDASACIFRLYCLCCFFCVFSCEA